MNKHTEAPWIADGRFVSSSREEHSIVSAAGGQIDNTTQEEAEANAHLISAAPDMLKALEMSLKAHKIMSRTLKEHGGGDMPPQDYLEGLLEHIIKKARGEV